MKTDNMADKALELEMKKHYAEAAQIHEDLGNYEKAAYLFQKSNQAEKGAHLLVRAGKYAKAAEQYMKIDDFRNAAQYYTQAEDYPNAALAFVRNGQLEQAARMFEKAQNWKEAAKIYMVLRNFMKAGELFEKAGDLIQSARTYELMIDQRETGTIEHKKDRDRIAHILMRVKRFEKAAEIYILSQEITEAIIMYLKVNDVPGAVRLYSNCQGDIGHELLDLLDCDDPEMLNNMQKMFEIAKDYKRAALVADKAGDQLTAARFFYQSGDFDQAAEMFLESGHVEQAAAMHVKAGNEAEAGRLFQQAGNLAMAAQAFEHAQLFFQAGGLFNQLERYDKAVELLQKIKSNDEHFLEASELISTIFNKKGMVDLAIQRYRKVVEETDLNDKSIEFYYRLAMILIEKNNFLEAGKLLQTIVAYNSSFKEATRVLNTIADQMAEQQKLAEKTGETETVAEEWEEAAPEVIGTKPPTPLSRSIVIGRMEGFEFLKKTNLFEDLNLQDMKLIWEMSETVHFSKGEFILHEDTPGEAFYIIKRGSVTVRKVSDLGEEILAHLLPGEHFGEMSIMDTSNTSASIIAEEEVEVFKLGREQFHKLLETQDRIALKIYRAFLKTLCQRLRISSDKLAYLKSCLEK
ncbi:cyclic nucleotide-binding domain-containing protein [bacterium]|nr:cyclic nucleotide-binding domain-containing protein [bacterium]